MQRVRYTWQILTFLAKRRTDQ